MAKQANGFEHLSDEQVTMRALAVLVHEWCGAAQAPLTQELLTRAQPRIHYAHGAHIYCGTNARAPLVAQDYAQVTCNRCRRAANSARRTQ